MAAVMVMYSIEGRLREPRRGGPVLFDCRLTTGQRKGPRAEVRFSPKRTLAAHENYSALSAHCSEIAGRRATF